MVVRGRNLDPGRGTSNLLSRLARAGGSTIFWIIVLVAAVLGGVLGKALVKGGLQSDSTPDARTYSASAEEMPTQSVGALSVNYSSPFVRNEQKSQEIASAAEAQAPGLLRSTDVYTSRPTCGLKDVGLIVSSFAADIDLSVDGAAQGSVNQISALEGVENPESSIVATTVSGLPARMISYRAKRWGGVLGDESLIIADLESNTLWQLQLIFSARRTSDYSRLDDPRACAERVMKSVALTLGR